MHPILDQDLFAPERKMVSVEGLGGEGAHSGTAFRAVDDQGQAYKLRDCGSERRAVEIEGYLRSLPWLFPAFVARDRQYVLTELLADHRTLTRHELLSNANRVGQIAARLHAAGRDGQTVPWSRRVVAATTSFGRFASDLLVVGARSGISLGSMLRIARKTLRRLAKYGIPIELELDDVHKDNFLWRPEDDDLRYVDEEAVGLAPRGLSMATLLKTANLSDTLEAYRAGFAEQGDAQWMVPGYVEWLLLLDAVRRVSHKLRRGVRPEKLPDEIAEIQSMADARGAVLDWRFPKDAIRAERQIQRRAARKAAHEASLRKDAEGPER